jgi:DNA-binding response OmpR family regulator
MQIVPINRILIADPLAAALNFSATVAEKMHFEVVTVSDGREAYRILQGDSNFIGAIFNLVMPYLDGPELIKFMRTEKRLMKIPAMLMTDRESLQLVFAGQKAGACALIQKPFTSNQFASMLGLLISQKHRLLTTKTATRPSHLQLAPVAKTA